jgi:SAM-dependent methyltransferase
MHWNDLLELQNTWEILAKEDPLWAILSVPSKRGRKWNLHEFFDEGRAEVARVLQKATSLHQLEFGTALDFGCGVGRVTQPLADHFQRVIGVDISRGMIELARKFNKQGDKVEYCHNSRNDLEILRDESFDFVYSNLVLQHMKPVFAAGYIREFFRITKPNGVIVFQIPSHLTSEYVARNSCPLVLPPKACRAQIRFVSGPRVLKPGGRAVLNFEIRNSSNEEWLQSRQHGLNLGNHWLLSPDHRMIVVDDGRAPLPQQLRPGEMITIKLAIKAPTEAGRYCLEVDLVQEGVRWFKSAGSMPLRLTIWVAGRFTRWLVPKQPAAAPTPTTFMMHGVPKEEIIALIKSAGAHLLGTEQNVSEWQSYKYYIAR